MTVCDSNQIVIYDNRYQFNCIHFQLNEQHESTNYLQFGKALNTGKCSVMYEYQILVALEGSVSREKKKKKQEKIFIIIILIHISLVHGNVTQSIEVIIYIYIYDLTDCCTCSLVVG